jgi:hypothetical protein
VRHEDDRLAALVAGPPERVEELAAVRVVEVAGRLVGEEDGGPGTRARRRRRAAARRRQLVRTVALLAGQLDEVDDLADALLLVLRAARDRERQGDVLADVRSGMRLNAWKM